MTAAIVISLAAAIAAAPRTPYGGAVVALAWGDAPVVDPAEIATAADFCLAGAVYEPLYGRGADGALLPLLAAGIPVLDGSVLVVPVRPGVVLHDGRTLTAPDVAAALRRLAGSTRGAGVLLPVVGVRRRIAGELKAPIEIEADGDTVRIGLVAPHRDFARLLASPRAAIAVAAGSDPQLRGTGPFAIAHSAAGAPLALVPHLAHRRGRPFLDRVVFQPAPTTFAARASLRRGDAAIAFGLPDLDLDAAREVKGRPPEELLVLLAGRSPGAAALRDRAVLAGMNAALNRERLSGRYLPGAAKPATTLLGANVRPNPELERPGARLHATLLLAPDRAPGLAFAERVQLDLLRAGVSAVIERVTSTELAARRRRGDFDLLLDTVLVEPGPITDAVDELHALLAIASWLGAATEVLTDADLAAFAAAPEKQRKVDVRARERELRERAAVIPIAVRPQRIWMRAALEGASLRGDGVLRLEDAYLAGDRP